MPNFTHASGQSAPRSSLRTSALEEPDRRSQLAKNDGPQGQTYESCSVEVEVFENNGYKILRGTLVITNSLQFVCPFRVGAVLDQGQTAADLFPVLEQ